jgi:hypothetical protein
MSKTGYVDPTTGAFLDMATDRGIYVERASTLYTVQFTTDPYNTVEAGNFDIPVAPGFTTVVPRSGTIVGACRYSHDLTNCLGDMIHVNISGKVQTKRVAASENVNNGILTIPFCADVNAGDIIHLYHYSGAVKTVATAMSSGPPIIYYTYVSYKEPFLITSKGALISSPVLGDITIRQDGTMFANLQRFMPETWVINTEIDLGGSVYGYRCNRNGLGTISYNVLNVFNTGIAFDTNDKIIAQGGQWRRGDGDGYGGSPIGHAPVDTSPITPVVGENFLYFTKRATAINSTLVIVSKSTFNRNNNGNDEVDCWVLYKRN